MPPSRLSPWNVSVGVAAVVGADTVMAWRADASAPHANLWLSLLDALVGVAFVAAAGAAPGPMVQRALVGGAGVAWLAGSWLPGTLLLHQAVLIIALLTFPGGRLRGPFRWACAALAVPVALGSVRQDGVAAVFLLMAAVSLADRTGSPAARWYPGLAAATSAVVLGAVRIWATTGPGSFDPAQATLAWQVTLLAVAVAFPVASRRVLSERRQLADRVLAAPAPSGLPGLATVLGQTLGDPSLRIRPWDGESQAVPPRRRELSVGEPGERRELTVRDGDCVVAVVEHATRALDDAATAEAVVAAVRLTATNAVLLREQEAVLAELEASRARLLAATDRVRQHVAATLRTQVEAPVIATAGRLAGARDALGASVVRERDRATVVEAVDVAVTELGRVGHEIRTLVAGVPPAQLGDGRLAEALASLAHGSPVPVTVRMDTDANANAQAETSLFYACSEALANAVKHAAASRVVIEVHLAGEAVEARVSDNGCGGADEQGSGLRGLADRLAACGGRLRVESSPGAGTVLSAVVPR